MRAVIGMAGPNDSRAAAGQPEPGDGRLWVERLSINDFRNFANLRLEFDHRPIILIGDNGAGKTNLLEAVSLLAAGHGLRGASYGELTRRGADAGWAVSAKLQNPSGPIEIGTGFSEPNNGSTARRVRINGESVRSSGALGDYVRVIWLTPAMDGLFSGPASGRRRFLDRLIQSLQPSHRQQTGRFERAVRQRNRALESYGQDALLEGLEIEIAEAGVAVAAARLDVVRRLSAHIDARRCSGRDNPFSWAGLALEGLLEQRLMEAPAVEVEDFYREQLGRNRARDRAVRRTLDGPHCSDLSVSFGSKGVAARTCSTGEQKDLLVGLVLAHLELAKDRHGGQAPLLLLDEIAAHLDAEHRSSLFHEIARLGAQAWMTGTDAGVFAPLGDAVQRATVADGGISD